MLKKIYCEKFLQKEVEFHSGLNAVVGDDIASNSIGKTTMLMIVDFVFGGEEYIKKNHDAVDQLGHHEFRFVFEFLGKDYFLLEALMNTNSFLHVMKSLKLFILIKWKNLQFGCKSNTCAI